jgi:hypothetical protein
MGAEEIITPSASVPSMEEFHPAMSDAEHTLAEIIGISDADRTGSLYAFAIQAPWRDRSKDAFFTSYFSYPLRRAWHSAEVEMVKHTCGGHYITGELCGLEINPVTCHQDSCPAGNLFRTMESDSTHALLQTAFDGQKYSNASYRLIRLKKRWVLDAVQCKPDLRFHW